MGKTKVDIINDLVAGCMKIPLGFLPHRGEVLLDEELDFCSDCQVNGDIPQMIPCTLL
jgi:hypothetical protein